MRAQRAAQRWADVPTSTVSAAGAGIVYRELGPRTGVPLVALTHLGANLDDWDPRVVDGLPDSDVLVPPVDGDELAGRLPATDVHILPDAGHGAVAQHGRQVVATMLDHLRRRTTTHHDQEKTS